MSKRNFLILLIIFFSFSYLPVFGKQFEFKKDKIIIVPLDSRNQTYDYVKYIVSICGYVPVLPSCNIMGNISQYDDVYKKQLSVWYWLRGNIDKNCKVLILSADSLIYGGLLESRESPISIKDALNNVNLIRIIKREYPDLKILVFTSIPRKEAKNRKRNFIVNKELIHLTKEGVIDFLTVSGDDVTDISNQVLEIARLSHFIENQGVKNKVFISRVDRIRLGIDESAMVIFIRYLNHLRKKPFKVYIEYRDITAARMEIDQYSATSIMSVSLDMVEAIGAKVVYNPDKADLILAINHFSSKFSKEDFLKRIEKYIYKKPLTIGDLSSRQEKAIFFKLLYKSNFFPLLAGYATWGMGTNTLGTSLCIGCASVYCPNMKSYSIFVSFLYERMIADYIYINNVHINLSNETGIPAYSLKRMSLAQERLAVFWVIKQILKNFRLLGMKFSLSQLECGRTEKEFNNQLLIYFNVEIPKGCVVGPFYRQKKNIDKRLVYRIIVGPISFPFHRLFEIRIPTRAKLLKRLE